MVVALFSITLIYLFYMSYIVWLKPKQYMGHIHERRERLKSQIPILPSWLIGFIFFYENPHLSIWWARIVIAIATVINVLGIVAAIHGPF